MRKLAGVLALLVLSSIAAFAQDEAGILKKWDFEDGVQGWMTLDAKGKLKATDAEDAVFAGKAKADSLTAANDQVNALFNG